MYIIPWWFCRAGAFGCSGSGGWAGMDRWTSGGGWGILFFFLFLKKKLGKGCAVGFAASTVGPLEVERNVRLGRGLLRW